METAKARVGGWKILVGSAVLAACFPPVEPREVDATGDVIPSDTSGQETTPVEDSGPQDALTDPDGHDCTPLDGACFRGVWNASQAACERQALVGTSCDDLDPCTQSDTCDAAGSCAGRTVDCDDGVACSIEHCSAAAGGCVYETSTCACSTDADCSDLKLCTSDVCDPKTWTCVNALAPGNPCNDFDPCTTTDVCDATGGCAGVPRACDDGNVCTSDTCDALSGDCVFAPVSDGTPCDDGELCSLRDRCVSGACQAGYVASFEERYPAYAGPFARTLLAATRLDDGTYALVDRVVYTGPEAGGYTGIFLKHVSKAGIPTATASEDFQGFLASLSHADPFSARTTNIEPMGNELFVLTNDSVLARAMATPLEPTWQVNVFGEGAPVARGLAVQGNTVVLCGDVAQTVGDGRDLWLGWVNAADGSIARASAPPEGSGVRGVLIRAIASGFLVVGLIDGADGDDLWLGRLDAQGTVIQWHVTYPLPAAQAPVALLPDSTAITLVARSASPVDGTDRAWVARVGYDGAKQWAVMPSDAEFTVAGAARTPDGGYLLVGRRPKTEQWYRQAHVLWLNDSGGLTSEEDGPAHNTGYTSVQSTETGYILTGSSGDTYFDSAGLLEVTDLDLNTPCDPTP